MYILVNNYSKPFTHLHTQHTYLLYIIFTTWKKEEVTDNDESKLLLGFQLFMRPFSRSFNMVSGRKLKQDKLSKMEAITD